jgi:hypothetical protein
MYREKISAPLFKTGVGLDMDRFFTEGGIAESIANAIGYSGCYTDEMDPELLEYWASYGKGLVKELHHADSTRAISRKFVSYIPKSAFSSENKNRRYPVILLLTGSRQNLLETEGYGFTQMAAENEVILIIPANVTDWGLMSVCAEILDTMPADPSRIYMAGFSFGAFRTTEFSILHPELIAATLTFGIEPYASLRWEFDERLGGPTEIPRMCTMSRTIPFSEQVYSNAAAYQIPFIHFMGTCEGPSMLPFYKPVVPENIMFYHTVEYLVDQINHKLKINGCKPTDILKVRASEKSENIVERKIGMPFDESHVEHHDGTEYYFGDLKSGDGIVRSRFVGVENMPHSHAGSYAQLGYDYISRFVREPEKINKVFDPYHSITLALASVPHGVQE